eukprot:CAMPEP_0194335746 /NCGR_PEP_ID=MMETSP0171-20130528/70616_1 /TAXON_ID=218684 /ORGANISM="Corethron pennatum, Strain L29A3" /LENGTH=65 /DNA_ID=CAMNT_0039098953 /DNA_START=219 /DNA_END=413 /DNA_ORIENTATION=+
MMLVHLPSHNLPEQNRCDTIPTDPDPHETDVEETAGGSVAAAGGGPILRDGRRPGGVWKCGSDNF